LKVFVAAALASIFAGSDKHSQPPRAIDVIRKLDDFFYNVGKTASRGHRPKDGTTMAVVRVDAAPARKVSYGSAGLPVYSLGRSGLIKHGDFNDSRAISFPITRDEPRQRVQPDGDVIDVGENRFLVVVTDGFRTLGRQQSKAKEPSDHAGSVKKFGEHGVTRTLKRGFRNCNQASEQPTPVACITKSLIKAAIKFRQGHDIPEAFDDDRLVVVIDLDAIWETPAEPLRRKTAGRRSTPKAGAP
jgi:hypothetical protein